jgi:ubiquinone/menaquinone biosynthesis C-methylase UbiE
MRALPAFCLLLMPAISAQTTDATQQIVESLYPKSQRLKETRISDLVSQLGPHEGSSVADVGCGFGEFSMILSRVVGPSGKVWCEDIRPGGVEIKRQHAKNVTIVKGADDDPKLPAASLDAVLIVDAYHEMPKYVAMLRHIRESLKPGGRLVILDNRPNRTAQRPREKQTNNHVLSVDLAAAEITAAGFRIEARDNGFLDNPDSEAAHWLIVAKAL